jgi:hypothetical protein
MATPEQIAELETAAGAEAERVFLELMIAHHRGALDMSEAVLERSGHPVVAAFARAVLASQQSEIDLMTAMLEERERRQRARLPSRRQRITSRRPACSASRTNCGSCSPGNAGR